MRGAWFFAGTLLIAAGVQAQDFEAGIRYWITTGMTEHSHDASSADPSLAVPTSVLNYDDLDANVAELYARKRFGESWFDKGNLGVGAVNAGTLTDQDFFFIGSDLFMFETKSGVSGKLSYGSIDVGRDVLHTGNTTVALFAGYHYWNERLDAYGLQDSFGPFSIPGTLVITNDLTWQSLRLGAEVRSVQGRTRFTAEVALIPYTRYENEDSHYLRAQPVGSTPFALGPVPNVLADGHGTGAQVELEVRRSFPQYFGLDLAVGYRYWKLQSEKGTQHIAGQPFAIVGLDAERHGLMLSVSKAW